MKVFQRFCYCWKNLKSSLEYEIHEYMYMIHGLWRRGFWNIQTVNSFGKHVGLQSIWHDGETNDHFVILVSIPFFLLLYFFPCLEYRSIAKCAMR